MIYYLVTRPHAYAIQTYLDTWGRELLSQIQVVFYDVLPYARRMPAGTYVFSDLERLTPAYFDMACELAAQLSNDACVKVNGSSQNGHGTRCSPFRVLNDPRRYLSRYPMLRALHEWGLNSFNVYRVTSGERPQRWPVFLRRDSDHNGSLSEMLNTQEELDRAIAAAKGRGEPAEDLLIVEFLDTANSDGVYRKYSACVFGDRIVPRHLLLSRKWVVKYADIADESAVREELDYINSNPHVELLRPIFELAGISYGRIDYAMVNGRVQTFEINTNPNMGSPPMKIIPQRLPAQVPTCRGINEALAALDGAVVNGNGAAPRSIPVTFSESVRRRTGDGPKQQWMRTLGGLMLRCETNPAYQRFVTAIQWAKELGKR